MTDKKEKIKSFLLGLITTQNNINEGMLNQEGIDYICEKAANGISELTDESTKNFLTVKFSDKYYNKCPICHEYIQMELYTSYEHQIFLGFCKKDSVLFVAFLSEEKITKESQNYIKVDPQDIKILLDMLDLGHELKIAKYVREYIYNPDL